MLKHPKLEVPDMVSTYYIKGIGKEYIVEESHIRMEITHGVRYKSTIPLYRTSMIALSGIPRSKMSTHPKSTT